MTNKYMHELVTVILPNFNSSKYIESTLDSVLLQTYSNLEIIIIDNGSTDNSPEIVRRKMLTDDRINLIELKQNSGGPAHPRNIGISKSSGSHLAFIDSDDVWHDKKISIQMNIIKDYETQFVACEKMDFYDDTDILIKEEYDENNISLTKVSFNKLLQKNTLSTSGVLIDKKLVKNLSFSEDKKYIAIEDYLLWLQIHENLSFSYFVNLPLLYYRKSSNSLTPLKAKIFIQKFLLFSLYKFSKKQPFLFRIKILKNYIMQSFFSYISSKK